MTMVDVDELTPSHFRAYYCGWIKNNKNLPEDKKDILIKMVQDHFRIMKNELYLVELMWRRVIEESKKPEGEVEKCPNCNKSDKVYKATKSESDNRMCSRCKILFAIKREV